MCVMLCITHCRVVHSGAQNSFSMPVMLSFWGKEENKSVVTDLMARRGYKLNSGGGGSEMMTSANKGNDRPRDLTSFLMRGLFCRCQIPHSKLHKSAFLISLSLTQWFASFR